MCQENADLSRWLLFLSPEITGLAETADFKGFFTVSNRDWSVTTVRLRLAPPGWAGILTLNPDLKTKSKNLRAQILGLTLFKYALVYGTVDVDFR